MPATQGRGAGLTPSSDIPDKLYFKIGEVSSLVGVAPHVLRYWEREVTAIRPGKTASNQRRYRRKDVEVFREVKRLLHEEKYTLAGARKRLANPGKHSVEPGDLQEAPVKVLAGGTEQGPVSTASPSPAGLSEFSRRRLSRVRAGLEELIEMVGTSTP